MPKSTNLGISKMWPTFLSSNLPEMLEDTKRQLFGKLIRQFQSLFDALHVI